MTRTRTLHTVPGSAGTPDMLVVSTLDELDVTKGLQGQLAVVTQTNTIFVYTGGFWCALAPSDRRLALRDDLNTVGLTLDDFLKDEQ